MGIYMGRAFAALFLIAAPAAFAGTQSFFFEPRPDGASYLARARTGVVEIAPGHLLWSRGSARVRQTMPGSTPGPVIALEKDSGETGYIVGNDPAKWRKHVPHFRKLARRNVYPGIDMEFHEQREDLEFDWFVAAGADPSKIVLRFDGMQALSKDPASGDLLVRTGAGDSIAYRKPRAGQGEVEVAASWTVDGAEARIQLAGYDRSRPLKIDPETLWLDRFGGSGSDEVVGSWLESGSVLVTIGNTESVDLGGDYPYGASNSDIFVSLKDLRFPGSSTSLTIIGGRGRDRVLAVGNRMAGGETNSIDFPVLESPWGKPLQRVYGGGSSDGFVLAFYGLNLGQISSSTLIGGSGDDRVLAVSENWFAGETNSTDLPLSQPAQARHGGGMDGFFGSGYAFGRMNFLSYWGGSADDRLTSILVSPANGVVRIGGQTKSLDFPLIPLSGRLLGGWDATLMEVNRDTGEVSRSGLWGGSGDDVIAGFAGMANGQWAFAANSTSPGIEVTN
jgi:hypothetical protein